MRTSRESLLSTAVHNAQAVSLMAKCPKCKKEVSKPEKTWKMAGRKDKAGKRTELTIGLYKCCGKTFRSVLNKRKI